MEGRPSARPSVRLSSWIWMLFGVVRGVSRGIGVLDFDSDRRMARGSFGVNLGCPIVTNGDFVA